MADVSVPVPAPFGDGDDAADVESRAQLILITGLTLAVLFVAVVLLLNTVIYTENLATRGTDAGGGEALDFREDAATDIGELLDRENRNNETDRADFEASVATYGDRIGDHRLRDGVVADVELDGATVVEGLYIAQDDQRAFTSQTFIDETIGDPQPDWPVATNVTATRGYELSVDSVDQISPGDGDTVEDDAFAVRTAGGSESWVLYVYRLDSMGSGEIGLRVDHTNGVGGTFNETVQSGSVTIDLTGGVVVENEDLEFRWADGVEDGVTEYEIRYENGDMATGTYALTVDDHGTVDVQPDYYGDRQDTSSEPYALDAVYSAEVTVGHRTQELHYTDRVRIAPGERDE